MRTVAAAARGAGLAAGTAARGAAPPRQLAAALPTPELRVELRSRDPRVAVRPGPTPPDVAAAGELRDAVAHDTVGKTNGAIRRRTWT